MNMENKIYVSTESEERLKVLKSRTGLTPNIICRFALMAQIDEMTPITEGNPYGVGREFNRNTLFGDLEPFFSFVPEYQKASIGKLIDRGIEAIYPRIHSLEDLVALATED